MLQVTPEQIAAFRLERSNLVGSERTVSAKRAAEKLFGAQAQVLSAGQLSLGMRSHSTFTEIEKELARNRSLVKTWAMRGTLHLLSTRDFALFASAIGSRSIESRIKNMVIDGVKRSDAERLIETLAASLTNEPMTRRELSAIVADSIGDWTKPWIENSWGGTVSSLCRAGIAVFGPIKGNQTTFVRRDAWVKKWKEHNAEEAQNEIARRYFSAYGPSTVSDFSFWLGYQVPFAKSIVDRIKDELTEVQITDGKLLLLLKKDIPRIKNAQLPSDHIRLLPHFDVFLLAHRNKDHLIHDKHYKKVYRTAGWISPTIISCGRVIGTWSGKKTKDTFVIQLEKHQPLNTKQKEGLLAAALHIAGFYGMKASLKGTR